MSEDERNEPAQRYRKAAERFLNGPAVEAAGIFWRDSSRWDPHEDIGLSFVRSLSGRWGRLRGYFLLAVTCDKVYALDYGGFDKFEITGVISVFDRDEVWLRMSDGGEAIYFEDRAHHGAVVHEHKGAAEVLAALAKKPPKDAGLSE